LVLEVDVFKILSNVYKTFFLKFSFKFIGWLFIKCSNDCILFHYMCHLKFNFWGHFNYMNIRIENQICKVHRVISWLWWFNLGQTLFVPSYTQLIVLGVLILVKLYNFLLKGYIYLLHMLWENHTHTHTHITKDNTRKW
jgi:hypothetical protein